MVSILYLSTLTSTTTYFKNYSGGTFQTITMIHMMAIGIYFRHYILQLPLMNSIYELDLDTVDKCMQYYS